MIVFARLVNWNNTEEADVRHFVQLVKQNHVSTSAIKHLKNAKTGPKTSLANFEKILF